MKKITLGKKGYEYEVDLYKTLPEGWRVDQNATTAPLGYTWIHNNKSRFGGERRSGLIKIENLKK